MAKCRSNQRRQWQNLKPLLTLLSPVLASLDITSFVKNEHFICGNEMNQPIIYRIFNYCSKGVNLTSYAARAGSHEDKFILGRGRTQLNQIGWTTVFKDFCNFILHFCNTFHLHWASTDLLWSKKCYVTNTGPQPTSFDPKNVTWGTRGPNRPIRCLDCLILLQIASTVP